MATNDLYPSDLDIYKVRLVVMDFSNYAGSATVYYNDGTHKWGEVRDTKRLVAFCQDKCIVHVRVAIASTKFNVQYELEGNESGFDFGRAIAWSTPAIVVRPCLCSYPLLKR